MSRSYSIEAVLSATDKGFSSAMKTAGKATDALTTSNTGVLDSIKNIVPGLAAYKLMSAAVNMVSASLDSAIARYDTLNRYPKVLELMGHSTKQAALSSKELAEGIQGLPTKLDDITSVAQNLTILTGDLEGSTDAAISLNNAFLASGSGAADASRGMIQYSQMLAKGKPDLQSFRTLQETMGYALNKTAEAFGYVGASAVNDLYGALKEGEISFGDFQDKLIELNGGVGGFAEMAKTSSGGIATAYTNMQTAIVRGTTSIIRSIDKGLSETKFKSIENIIGQTGKSAEAVLSGVIAPAFEFVAANADKLIPILGGVGAAYLAWAGPLQVIQGARANLNVLEGVAMEQGRNLAEVLKRTTDNTEKASIMDLQRKAAMATTRAEQQKATAAKLEEIAATQRLVAEGAKEEAQRLKSRAQVKLEEEATKASKKAKDALREAQKLSTKATKAENDAKKAAEIASKATATADEKLAATKLREEAATLRAKAASAMESAEKKQAVAISATQNAESKKTELVKSKEAAAIVANTVAEDAEAKAKTAGTLAAQLDTTAVTANTVAKQAQTSWSTVGAAAMAWLTGATTAQTGAVTFQTVATLAAAAATTTLSAAINILLGPLGVILIVIAAVVAGVIALVSHIKKSNAAYYESKKEIEGYKKKNEELQESLQKSKEDFKDSGAAAAGAAKTNLDMANSVKELSEKYTGSAASARTLEAKIQILNASCKDLNLSFDKTSGALSMTNEEIDAFIAASEQSARKTALKDHMSELSKQLGDVQGQILAAEMKFEDLDKQLESGEITVAQHGYAVKDLKGTIKDLGGTSGEVSEEMSRYESAYTAALAEEKTAQDALLASQKDKIRDWAETYYMSYEEVETAMNKEGQTFSEWSLSNIDKLEESKAAIDKYAEKWGVAGAQVASECAAQGVTLDKWNDNLQGNMENALDTVLGTYETMTAGLSDLSTKIEEDSEKTWAAITKNQADTIPKVKEFSNLYAQLIKAGVSESYLDAIGATGPEALPLLRGMLESGTDAVLAKQGEWEDAYNDVLKQPLKKAMNVDGDTTKTIQNYIAGETGIKGTLQSAIKGVNFEGLGKDIVSGVGEGVVGDAPKVAKATGAMAIDAGDAFASKLGIRSPSRVFMGYGENIVSGLVQGIKSSASNLNGLFDAPVQSLTDSINVSLKSKLANVKTIFQSSFLSASNAVTVNLSKILDSTTKALNELEAKTRVSTKSFNTIILSGFSKSTTDVQRELNKMPPAVQTAMTKINSLAQSGTGKFRSTMSSGMNAAVSIVKTATGSILSVLNISNQTYSAGINAMAGLKNGLNAGAGSVYATANSIANNVANTVRKALQIHSPSRVLKSLGGYTMEGFALGMENMQSYISKVVNDTSNIVTSGLNSALSAGDISESISANISSPTTDGLLERLIGAVENGSVIVMDGDAVVGATYERYDAKIGQTAAYTNRWRGVAVT